MINILGYETGTSAGTAVDVLRQDHIAVKGLFQDFAAAQDAREQRRVATQAIEELIKHAAAEEEVFYPAVRRARSNAETDSLMDEAREEHHVAKMLIRELSALPTVDATYRAKFTVLAELVKHHITEEEGEIFPLARTSGIDLEALRQEVEQAKEGALAQWRRREGAATGRTRRTPAPSRNGNAPKRRRTPAASKSTGRRKGPQRARSRRS